ncbi:hypothetical protein ACFSCW_04050 [Sphingomonas tabacisoli]|uniref:Uncharacterized protein n=1 Tax=Sphingomonas tabacisoli TaxID=2249466 RepID=A0ABW4I1J1_9SPHN
MLEALEARAEAVGARAVARAKRRLVAEFGEPGIDVAETERGVVLSGRGLWLRLLASGRLRWIGGLLR